MGTILTGTDEERKEFQRTPPFAFLESRSVIPPLPCVNKRGNWHTKKGLLKSHHQLVVKSDQQPVLLILSQRLYNRTCPYYSEYVPGSNPRKLQALWGQKPISHQPWHSLVPSISRRGLPGNSEWPSFHLPWGFLGIPAARQQASRCDSAEVPHMVINTLSPSK